MLKISNIKYIIVIRHGERIDKVQHLQSTQILPKYDPELSSKGKSQAEENGILLQQFFTSLQMPIILSSFKVKCISSPYTRTLQTSKAILTALSLPLKIHVDNQISEFLDEAFEGNSPIDFLSIIQGNNSSSYAFYKEEMKNVDLIIRNDYSLLPKVLEKRSELVVRVENFSKELLKELYEDNNKDDNNAEEIEIVMLVSHGAAVTHLCDYFGYEKHMNDDDVRLCDYFIFELGKDEKTGKIKSRFINRKTHKE